MIMDLIQKKSDMIKKSPAKLIAFGFIIIILIGAFLLTLPVSVRSGKMNFINALFTATSASCVTGLIVTDTYRNWTLFGQIIIICLIQIGGLGFITIGVYISVLLKKRIGLQDRENLHESVNTLEIAGVVRLVKKIVKGTFIIEGTGAVLLAIRFIPEFGLKRGIYFSIFHSISAFCNAGFDLMGINGAYSSLVAFDDDIIVNVVIMLLIIIGGIGFIVWDDIMHNKWHFKRYLLHTKIVLIVSALLIIIPAILFWFTESNGVFAGMTPVEKVLGALFCAVSPRTAGFNTVDLTQLSNSGLLVTMILMFIGGSPGSTAGGAKTTTIVVLVFYAITMIRNREDINLFGRRLTEEVVKKANAVVTINLSLALLAAVIIMFVQPYLPMPDVIFEVLSELVQ